MSRAQPIYCDNFCSPLTEDVEELLSHFQQIDSVRFEEFSAIWREMAFSDMFLGIPSTGEMKRFCRVTLATAVKYFLPPYSYQIRVGGLYLLYGFYHLQLSVPPLKIRLALKDWDSVQKFLRDAVNAGHYDVVYVFKKLAAAKAIHYTAMPHFLTFQKQRIPKREPMCADLLGRTVAVRELISVEKIEEIANIQSHYEKLKQGTVEVQSNIAMIQQDFATRLKDTVSEFISWQEKTFSTSNKVENPCDGEGKAAKQTCRTKLPSVKLASSSYFRVASKRHRPAEKADSSSSEDEVRKEMRCKRPPSLRARTCKNLEVMQEDTNLQSWLLTAPDQANIPVKKTSHVAPVILELAQHKTSKTVWATTPCEKLVWGNQEPIWPVSPSALGAVPSARILYLAKHKRDFSAGDDPWRKKQEEEEVENAFRKTVGPSSKSSQYEHIEHLSTPKTRSRSSQEIRRPHTAHCEPNCPIWHVGRSAKAAVVTPRLLQLSNPKRNHPDFQRDRDSATSIVSFASKSTQASQRLVELSLPRLKDTSIYCKLGQPEESIWIVSRAARRATASARINSLATLKQLHKDYVVPRNPEWNQQNACFA
ncbi:snRNA-activating protein complex subunit 1-like [Thalassophryne amazonica]|uniref:snRNA-activating protein complex subunit 1-like n=1 Tax=Thalassophryne amazonica TaxID=390379 RepID=UPI0014724810|nr:snRNA-activating protein complex subunit 1-like [Thalassophryne amazonica]